MPKAEAAGFGPIRSLTGVYAPFRGGGGLVPTGNRKTYRVPCTGRELADPLPMLGTPLILATCRGRRLVSTTAATCRDMSVHTLTPRGPDPSRRGRTRGPFLAMNPLRTPGHAVLGTGDLRAAPAAGSQ